MFKKYSFGKGLDRLDFYVQSKAIGNKSPTIFAHRACIIGSVPRLDTYDEHFEKYSANSTKLLRKRVAKIRGIKRYDEFWLGQKCLIKLWDQISELSFVDLRSICASNPFVSNKEPAHVVICEADTLFKTITNIAPYIRSVNKR